MADELLDLINKDDEVIGTVLKSVAHKDPSLTHREIAIAIFNDKGEVLLQQRSIQKIDPGKWTISAAGHVEAGEEPEKSVKREVKEELGLDIDPVFHKKEFNKYKDQETRIFWVYYALVKEAPKLKLQKEEVMDAKWVNIRDLEKFGKHNDYDTKSISHKTIIKLAKLLKIL
jgi:mutator protein MutT